MEQDNETLVAKIRAGISVSDNIDALYRNMIPLIKKITRPYTAYESSEDLEQEAFFGILQAVQHYESSENTRFSTYSVYWIKNSALRYLDRCGSIVRVPYHTRRRAVRYRKAMDRMRLELGRSPTDQEVAESMGISMDELLEIKGLTDMLAVTSLDAPLPGDTELTLADTLQADFSLENETLGKISAEDSKRVLWDVLERNTSDRESFVVKELFVNRKSMVQVAREQGVSVERVRQIKENALRKIRRGKARRELLETLTTVEAKLYRGGFRNYESHNNTSVTEYCALKTSEAKERYERRLIGTRKRG